MQPYEMKSLMDYGYYSNKDDWEQCRLIAFMIAQTNSKKKLKLQDILKFQWEKESENTTITNEEINELSEQAKAIEAIFNNNENTI